MCEQSKDICRPATDRGIHERPFSVELNPERLTPTKPLRQQIATMIMHSTTSRYALTILLSTSALLGTGCQKSTPSAPAPPPAEVFYCRPLQEMVTDFEEFPGRTEAFRSVEVRARVTGYLEKVLFVDGSEVKKDALLFQIDPRPYQAESDRAKATLEQATARETRLEGDYRRLTALLNRGTATREEFDRTVGDLAEARAAVGIAKAQWDLTQLDLDYTRVTAAIPGRISRRMVDPGNLVKADETLLTTIVSLDPMYVNFDIDERTLLRMRRLIGEGKIKSRNETTIPILAALADESDFTHEGNIDFSDNRVDPSTGTLRVRGLIENPLQEKRANTRVLSPGMFLRVRLPIGESHKALLIPEQSVGTDQDRKFVFVLKSSRDAAGQTSETVESRPVEVGRLLDRGLRVVEKGLDSTDRVVVRGLQRIKQGTKVTPVLDREFGTPPSAPAKQPSSESPETPPTQKSVVAQPPR